jgi:hypothetical protein
VASQKQKVFLHDIFDSYDQGKILITSALELRRLCRFTEAVSDWVANLESLWNVHIALTRLKMFSVPDEGGGGWKCFWGFMFNRALPTILLYSSQRQKPRLLLKDARHVDSAPISAKSPIWLLASSLAAC